MEFRLSDGEIHFLWWFIQGSIMNPYIRRRLQHAWGFCERHAWAFILVDAELRRGWMHGPAILYEDLMERAVVVFDFRAPDAVKRWRLARDLAAKGPCIMCDAGYGPDSEGYPKPEVVVRVRRLRETRAFAQRTSEYWKPAVCGTCSGKGSPQRCRRHLIEDAARGGLNDIGRHRGLVDHIARHMKLYSRSFRWECRDTETAEDMAALLAAVGWLSGWGPLLSMMEGGSASLKGRARSLPECTDAPLSSQERGNRKDHG